MNCIVCIACVPDTASIIKIGPDGKHIDETGIKWIVSPYDEYALEEALKITEAKGGEVTVVTFGPDRAEAALRDCLARGAHKAIHVRGGEASLGDSFTIDIKFPSDYEETSLAGQTAQFDVKINRGGDITYHGPGQIVGYPILNLDYFVKGVREYIEKLEESIILTLKEYNIAGEREEA